MLGAIDLTTIEVWTKRGLVTFYLLFGMEVATRRVHFVGCTTNPNGAWMKQIARILTDSHDGFLLGTRYLLMDRDTKFCEAFRFLLDDSSVTPVRLPARSPNLNAHLERFMLSLKVECLNRMIFFGERSARRAVRQYLEHYHGKRNHQGLQNRLIAAGEEIGRMSGKMWDSSTMICPTASFRMHGRRALGDRQQSRGECNSALLPGRRNWLSSDTVPGAEASANHYSLVVTARCSASLFPAF